MITRLREIIHQLPALIETCSWDSLIINKRKPYTYRVFTYLDNLRLCLHRFDSCNTEEAFFHPHPWPGAFCILSGSYEMELGFSQDLESKPENVCKVILPQFSLYEIIEPRTWHKVVPLGEVFSVMINGTPWSGHKDTRTTKGKDLQTLPQNELEQHLEKFRQIANVAKFYV